MRDEFDECCASGEGFPGSCQERGTAMNAALIEELTAAIEKETSSYDPVAGRGDSRPDSLKRAEGSDMSGSAAKAIRAIIQRELANAWDEGFDAGYDDVLVERSMLSTATDLRENPYRTAATS